MPRGAKKDAPITKMLRANGLLLDRRSFVGYDPQMVPHLFLKGIDKVKQRARIFICYEKCAVCGAKAIEIGEPGFASEWHHKRNCDCIACAEVRCGQLVRDCHRHRVTGFNRDAEKQKAAKDFNKLYDVPEEKWQHPQTQSSKS